MSNFAKSLAFLACAALYFASAANGQTSYTGDEDRPWNYVDHAKTEGVVGMLYESSSRYHTKIAYRFEEHDIVQPQSTFLPAPTEVPKSIKEADSLTKEDIDRVVQVYDKALIMKALRTYGKTGSLIKEIYIANPPRIGEPGNEHLFSGEDKVTVRIICNDVVKTTSKYDSTINMTVRVENKEFKKALLNVFNMRHLSTAPLQVSMRYAIGSADVGDKSVELQRLTPTGIGYLIQLFDEEYNMLIESTIRTGGGRPTFMSVEVRDIYNKSH